MSYRLLVTPLYPIGLVTLPYGGIPCASMKLACKVAMNLDLIWSSMCILDDDSHVVFEGNRDDVLEGLAGRVPESMKDRWTEVPAELEVPTVPADHFAAMLSVKVDNEKLSNAEFREFVRNTLPIVIYSGGNRKKEV